MSELSPVYDPAAIERDIYARWLAAGCFVADPEQSARVGGGREPFATVMPPPNVTAALHMGHGLNNTVQDVIVRWRRMAGDETLWVPGTDHAGIATQNVIEKQLAKEGLTRADLGREAFIARTEQFVEETGGVILEQLRSIGASCDWSRTAYTFSPELSHAVRAAFVNLYDDNLIYRGHRVIHWCPRCLTSLSDEEAEFEEEDGVLYQIAYPLVSDASRALIVATTRPETMLGDVAVAVHPDDERYRDLIGQSVRLPILDIPIPIIADAYADPAFGTGVVKITPAHDANDFEVGLRHDLAMPVVIDQYGLMGEGPDGAGRVPESLRGVDRFVAREQIVAQLREAGRLVKQETHRHAVRHCYRCGTVVEPRLSDQWFVRMKPLAEPALAGVRDRSIRVLPERWEAVYVNWLEGIRDWNISRQLWWGHRVPVWYCDDCGSKPLASIEDITRCPSCGGPVRQDEDVLDTWFSSWLWPISTLGWPDTSTRDLAAFYPTDVLVTAPEIIFFWVARMVMAGYRFMGRTPFHTVYLTGTVRDMNHVKMSKSLGNGIDPLDVVALYGADALRYTVVAGLGMGADVMLDPAHLDVSFAPGRNFATKLWNIGRFLLGNAGTAVVPAIGEADPSRFTRSDAWILQRLDDTIAECDAALGPPRPCDGHWADDERYRGLRLSEYAEAARRFAWDELAAWYVESIKARLAAGGPDGEIARAVLVHVFDQALRLLHPVVPFITEALWQRLPGRRDGEFLARAGWPQRVARDAAAAREFDLVRDAVTAIRQLRNDNGIQPGKQVDVIVVPASADARRTLNAEAELAGRLARSTLSVADAAPAGAAATSLLGDGTAIVMPLAGAIDVGKECGRLRGELMQLEKQLQSLGQRLENTNFLDRAKPEVVASEREKHREWSTRRTALQDKVKALCGA